MPERRSPLAAAVLLLSTTLAACGGPEGETAAADDGNGSAVSGTAPAAARGVPSVVLLRPADLPTAAAPATDTLVMDQASMAFSPGLLLVRRGQTVRFQNSEDVAHNVQVRSPEADTTLFNVGTARGSPFWFTFERTGAWDVLCDIHPGMSAVILVHDAPYAARAERDGSFTVPDVPPGSYMLEIWSAEPGLRGSRRVEVGPGGAEVGPG